MHLSDVVYHGQPRGWACRQRAHEIDDIVCDPVARLMARFGVVGGVLFRCHFSPFRVTATRFCSIRSATAPVVSVNPVSPSPVRANTSFFSPASKDRVFYLATADVLGACRVMMCLQRPLVLARLLVRLVGRNGTGRVGSEVRPKGPMRWESLAEFAMNASISGSATTKVKASTT